MSFFTCPYCTYCAHRSNMIKNNTKKWKKEMQQEYKILFINIFYLKQKNKQYSANAKDVTNIGKGKNAH